MGWDEKGVFLLESPDGAEFSEEKTHLPIDGSIYDGYGKG